MTVAIALRMGFVKLRDHRPRVGHVQLISLTCIADIDAATLADRTPPALQTECALGGSRQLCKLSCQPCDWQLSCHSPQNRPGEFLYHIADEYPERRQGPGHGWHNHARNPKRLRQFAGVQSTCPSEGDQCETPRIVPALDRHDANGLLHSGIHHPDYARCELLAGEIRVLLRQPFPDHAPCSFQIELEASTEKTMPLQSPEQQIGIGDSRQSSLAIADRPGVRSR